MIAEELINVPPILTGKRVYLSAICLTDVSSRYCEWLNDPQVNQFLEVRLEKTSMESLHDFVASIIADPVNILFTIKLIENDFHFGNIKIGPINKYHGFAEVGIVIGEKECWGKGFASEALELVVDFSFNTLGLHKLTAGCYANNSASKALFTNCGFEIEGIKKNQWLSNGNYVDAILFGFVKPMEKES